MPEAATEPLMYATVESPIGELLLLGDGRALCALHMQEGRKAVAVEPGWRRSEEPFSGFERSWRSISPVGACGSTCRWS